MSEENNSSILGIEILWQKRMIERWEERNPNGEQPEKQTRAAWTRRLRKAEFLEVL